jgi:ABC-type glycerol-3-phosphate transport system substrate-binding protein
MLHRSLSRRRFLALSGALAASGPLLAHDLGSAAASGLDAQPQTIEFWVPNSGPACVPNGNVEGVS